MSCCPECHAAEMVDDLLIARNPDPASSLPFLIRVPLGPAGIVVKARDSWPRTAKVYCHRADGWPANAEILERLSVGPGPAHGEVRPST